jgi:hypothetical protein
MAVNTEANDVATRRNAAQRAVGRLTAMLIDLPNGAPSVLGRQPYQPDLRYAPRTACILDPAATTVVGGASPIGFPR